MGDSDTSGQLPRKRKLADFCPTNFVRSNEMNSQSSNSVSFDFLKHVPAFGKQADKKAEEEEP